jgi:hypothetical protein
MDLTLLFVVLGGLVSVVGYKLTTDDEEGTVTIDWSSPHETR